MTTPNTDRELLELAAKAAGMSISDHIGMRYDYFADDSTGNEWNPLQDDGDALRLAVKLAESAPGTHFTLSISKIHDGRGFADAGFFSHINPTEQVVGPDLAAATRRAIVRAAAENRKGNAMKTRIAIAWATYRLYRSCNPRRVAISAAWSAIKRG